MSKLFLGKRLEVITAGIFLFITMLLCSSGWFSYSSLTAYLKAQQRLAVISTQLRALNDTFSTIQDAETGQRGFLLTNQIEYLEPYTKAVNAAPNDLAWLRRAFTDEPKYGREIGEIERLKTSKFNELATTVDLVKSGNFDRAKKIVASHNGKDLMDQVRSIITKIQREKRRELAEIQAASEQQIQESERATAAFAIAIGIFLIIAYCYLIYDLAEGRRLRSARRTPASLDPLTGIHNLKYFTWSLTNSIKHAIRTKNATALMVVELRAPESPETDANYLRLLTIAAARELVRSVPDPHLAARLDSTTFAVLVHSFRNPHDLATLAQKIATDLTFALIPDSPAKYVDVHIGIAVHPADGENSNTMIQRARLETLRGFKNRNSRFSFVSESLAPTLEREEILTKGLHRAIEQEAFTIRYQPQVDLMRGKIIGVEALIRWEHPHLGSISPDEFIPLAERTGLIIPIGALVLEQACSEAMRWPDAHSVPRLAVNVSAVQLSDPGFLQLLTRTLDESKLPPSRLEIELTERVIAEPRIASVLTCVRELGVHISIDDFGTGYSSLSYLARFPANVLKIDRSFINNVPACVKDSSVVRTIINIGRELGIRTIAEGVETPAQANFLSEHGCDVGQGYLFHKPIFPDELFDLLLREGGPRSGALVC